MISEHDAEIDIPYLVSQVKLNVRSHEKNGEEILRIPWNKFRDLPKNQDFIFGPKEIRPKRKGIN